jgi:hypothetical protein
MLLLNQKEIDKIVSAEIDKLNSIENNIISKQKTYEALRTTDRQIEECFVVLKNRINHRKALADAYLKLCSEKSI